MRLRRRTSAAALAAAVALGALLWGSSTASARTVLPDSAHGFCPSCQVDDPEAPIVSTSIVISGHGWGHGLGLSQWGAYGMAKRGLGFQRILRFYYQGTTLGPAPVSVVRVLLADGAQRATVSSALPFTASDGSGRDWTIPAAGVALDPTLGLPVGPGGTTQFVAGPLTFRSAVSTLLLDGKAYRGSLRVSLVPPPPSVGRVPAIVREAGTTTAAASATGVGATPAAPAGATSAGAATAPASAAIVSPGITTPVPATGAPAAGAPGTDGTAGVPDTASPAAPASGLRIVNTVGLEAYLAGVVASEMPASWPAAALQAQAVAARSYALANRSADPAADFDLYSDVRSQVYGGVAAEHDASTAAVQATSGQVLLWKGAVADTRFSASNGGRTQSWAASYPGLPNTAPYLVAKDDPYDAEVSPYRQWGPLVVDGSRLEGLLGLPGPLVDLTSDAVAGGRPSQLTAVTSSGTVDVAASTLRRVLDLKSSWVSIGVLSLSPVTRPATYGAKVTLSGLVRNVDGATVEQRSGSGWQAVGPVVPDADGRFALTTRALASTDLRLSATRLLAATTSATDPPDSTTSGSAAPAAASAVPASGEGLPYPPGFSGGTPLPVLPGGPADPGAAAPAVTSVAPGAVTLALPVTGAVLALPVAPKVRISAAAGGAGVTGVLRPVLSGVQIEIQFDGTGTGTTWLPVGTATVGADGAFAASFPVATGAYRAVVPGSAGLAALTSAPVKVAIAS